MSKTNADGAVIKKIASLIHPTIAKMLEAMSDEEIDKLAEVELAEILSDFAKSPAARTAATKVKAVHKNKVIMTAKTDLPAEFTAHLVAGSMTVERIPPPPSPSQTPENSADCEGWWELYSDLAERYIEQFDNWVDCLAGPQSSSSGNEFIGNSDVWPGVPDVLLGESTPGRCGEAWDAVAETGQELESMEFAMRSVGCM